MKTKGKQESVRFWWDSIKLRIYIAKFRNKTVFGRLRWDHSRSIGIFGFLWSNSTENPENRYLVLKWFKYPLDPVIEPNSSLCVDYYSRPFMNFILYGWGKRIVVG